MKTNNKTLNTIHESLNPKMLCEKPDHDNVNRTSLNPLGLRLEILYKLYALFLISCICL